MVTHPPWQDPDASLFLAGHGTTVRNSLYVLLTSRKSLQLDPYMPWNLILEDTDHWLVPIINCNWHSRSSRRSRCQRKPCEWLPPIRTLTEEAPRHWSEMCWEFASNVNEVHDYIHFNNVLGEGVWHMPQGRFMVGLGKESNALFGPIAAVPPQVWIP